MIPVAVGLAAALVTLAAGWIIGGGMRLARRANAMLARDRRSMIAREPNRGLADPELRASAIVKDAEEKAEEILQLALEARARLEQEVARGRQLATEVQDELSTFVLDLLAEIQRASHGQVTKVHDLSNAREARTTRAGAAD